MPLFPSLREAIGEFLDINNGRYSEINGVLFCLPNYGAKIEEVKIGSKEIMLKIQPKYLDLKDIIGKLLCERGKIKKHVDVDFKRKTEIVSIKFMPDSLYVAIVSKKNNELIDSRRYYSSWESLPKGVTIKVPNYEIKELIRHGESETVEFKQKIGRFEKIAITAVAFANNRGGVIIFGVNDSSEIVGLTEGKNEDTITNILRNNCNPQIEYEISKRQLGEKEIIIVHVEEGKDKPYFVREKGPYIRVHATNRIMTRQEIDEIQKSKQSVYQVEH